MQLRIGEKAPDFIAEDWQGRPFSLADHKEEKNLFLVFNRGFV